LQVFVVLKALDIGGGISIHIFGAYYGLAASWALPRPAAFHHHKSAASYSSDITAMVGGRLAPKWMAATV
jgi:ammonium transporter Rh